MVGNVGGDNLDVLTYGLLNKKVEEAKNVSGEKITEAVNTYFEENPVAPGATSEQAEQIQDNTNKITELKSDLAYFLSGAGEENLLEGVTETTGYIVWGSSNGQPSTAYPNYKYYDYVEIEGGTAYSLDSAGSFSNFYDVDKTYISTVTDKTFVSPSNAKYIIVSDASTSTHTLFCIDDMEAVDVKSSSFLRDIEKLKEDASKTYVVDINGNGDFTSVLGACVEAIKTKNSKVIIKRGTYDIKAEALALYGSSYTGAGVYLQNGVHVIGDSDAYLICDNREGSDQFRENFSIFNAGSGDFTIENVNMIGYNIRYNIHDERGYSDDNSAKHQYIGCNMYLDNQEYNSSHPSTVKWQCIGGGLGKRANILVESCIFESIGATSTDGIVSYHGNGAGESVGTIIIKDNYFKTGTVRFGDYGSHSKKTNCIVSNNKLCGEIIHKPEITGQNLNHFDIYAWGNIIE